MPHATAHRSATAEALAGAELIKSQLRALPNGPGVYRMFDGRGSLLYVGKAKSLRKRVGSYTKPQGLPARIQRMVALTRSMEFVSTTSEVEALLLESNLIKRHRPSFNIVLRDDKSFPYIYLRLDHEFPMIGKHRGGKKPNTEYYGPFASAGAVNDTLNALLRAFPLRNCSDAIFESRVRPCLQYQIKRCSAPCVQRIDSPSYNALVEQVRGFLGGSTRRVQSALKSEMEKASSRLDFEQAALLRDRLKAIAHITSRQDINTPAVKDADIIAAYETGGQVCIQVFFYRGGRNYGNRSYFPTNTKGAAAADVAAAFAAQFYADRTAPSEVLLSHEHPENDLLAEALTLRAERRVRLAVPKRGAKFEVMRAAIGNAKMALERKLSENASQAALLEHLAERLDLDAAPKRIEVYDNSHIRGSHAVGAFIVSGPDGLDRKAYRTFNIKSADIKPGDDFAMMREVLVRRFKRLVSEDDDRSRGLWPDLVIVDGGAGQLSSAQAVFDELGIGNVALVGVAKGPERDAGEERFFRPGLAPFTLARTDPVLYLVQRLRDEAHRFVITAHRSKRAKSVSMSVLDRVPGIGAKRKKALLSHFGSAREVQGASLRDLEQVPGISKAVAQSIHDHFHEQG